MEILVNLRSAAASVFLLGLVSYSSSSRALAQIPEVTSGGVVSAASWSSPVTPGEIVAIFGNNLSNTPQSANGVLTFTLGGTSVAINGVPAPLLFVSPTQINAEIPFALPVTNYNVVTAKIVVTTSAGSSPPANLSLTSANPGFFSVDASGCGQAAALNIAPNGDVSVNSPSNSAAPGDYFSLFGTGFGVSAQQPPDGSGASGPSALQALPTLLIDGNPLSFSYAGLAPLLPGVDQINFQVPPSTRNGCAVPVSASQLAFGSPLVTISVQSGRGQCSNPPIQSYGQISLDKALLSPPPPPGEGQGPITITEGLFASFPSGPAVQPPAPDKIVFAPEYVANVSAPGAVFIFSDGAPINLRTCLVPGYSHLSAGTIQIQPPAGSAVSAPPQPLLTGGVSYGFALPTGFIGPGIYTLSGSAGSDVGLQTNVVVGSPIQLQTSFAPGMVISSSQPLAVRWTGGDPGTLVKVSLFSGQGATAAYDYSYADAADGSLTISPVCSGEPINLGGNGRFCSFELPQSSNAHISVQVLPRPDHVATVSVPGITGPVQLGWQYSYTFYGLTLGP